MSSASGDIWGNSDELRMVYKRFSGDGSIIARVDSLDEASWHAALNLSPLEE